MNFQDMDGIIDPSASSTLPPMNPNGLSIGLTESRSASFSSQDADGVPTPLGDLPRLATPGSRQPSSGGITFPSSESSISAQSASGSFGRRLREGSSATQASSTTGFWTGSHHNLNGVLDPVSPTTIPSAHPQSDRSGSGYSSNGLLPTLDRRPSIAMLSNGIPPGSAGGPLAAGAWTAPDSWAVKGEGETGAMDHDSSDEGPEDDDGDEPSESNEELSAETREVGTFPNDDVGGVFLHSANGRPGTAGGRPSTRSGRPGTSDGMIRFGTQKNVSGHHLPGGFPSPFCRLEWGRGELTLCCSVRFVQFMIRIFRQDSTFSTLPAPLTATAAELLATLGRKFQVNAKAGYSLYMREKGLGAFAVPLQQPPLVLTFCSLPQSVEWDRTRSLCCFRSDGSSRRATRSSTSSRTSGERTTRTCASSCTRRRTRPSRPTCVSLLPETPRAKLTWGLLSQEDDIGDSLEFVDLSGKNVETIPIFLYKHAHEIVSLNLSKNRPFDLPTDFVQGCTSLRELVLSHMGIKRIPQAVRECVGLTRLDISNNHIVDLEHIALDEVGELTSLKCHNNRLWTLPDYFSRFRLLKYLNLSNNRFESLPSVVCEILAVVELDISFNTITSVQPEIGQLCNLERLVLLANSINFLPPTLSALVHLKELDCRRNNISDLSAISGVQRLEVLRCEYNQASVLDANWAHMRILTASNNSVTRFALSGTSSTLTSLNLSHAKLASLAVDMFDHLGSIENLVFDSNQIRVLPEGVGSLSNLVMLSIKNNILDELPATIGKLQRLQSLQVSGNNLHDLPAAVWLCGQLSVLNASSNLMKDFPDPPLQAAHVDPSVDDLESRKASTISKAPSTPVGRLAPPLALSLQKLYLGDNRLGDDVFAPISLMTELRVLNLSFNDIYEIPSSSLFKSQQLEELYLSGNKLTSLPPDDLERLAALKLLYLNGNKLQTLPAELGKIKNLYALDVGSNVLKYNIANWPYDWNWCVFPPPFGFGRFRGLTLLLGA